MNIKLLAALMMVWVIPALAVDPAPLPKAIREAKKIYIVNENVENTILDHVYDRMSKWSRWTIVENQQDADIVVVLSGQDRYFGSYKVGGGSTTNATATTYGNTTVVGIQTQQQQPVNIPLVSFNRYLVLVDAKTGVALLSVSCELRLVKSATAKYLVNRLKDRFPARRSADPTSVFMTVRRGRLRGSRGWREGNRPASRRSLMSETLLKRSQTASETSGEREILHDQRRRDHAILHAARPGSLPDSDRVLQHSHRAFIET